jgi:MFS family permease
MGRKPVVTGIGFLCSSIAQVVFLLAAGRFVDRAGRRPAMVLGTLLGAGSLLILAVSASIPVFLLSMTASGVGGAFVGTAPGAVVGDIMHGRGGRVVAVFQMASDAGSIGGPLLAGWLADSASFGAAFTVSAGVLLVACLMSLRMPETLPSARIS